MLKLREKFKRKKKKVDQGISDNGLPDDCDRGDTSLKMGGSRNSSKNSLTLSQNDVGCGPTDIVIHQYNELEEKEAVSPPKKPDGTVLYADHLHDVFIKKHADEDRLFRAEFESIPAMVTSLKPQCEYARRSENSSKNRYRNVVTCDDSRVKLSVIDDVPGSDYINASFINGFESPNKFIAAQGPKDNTVVDFWRMVWEHHCCVIVMITELRELGRQKCSKYWPDDGTEEYGDLTVQSESTFEYGGFTKRLLKVTHKEKKDEVRTVAQFQYHAWPDHGVPKSTSEIFRFRNRTLQSQPSHGGPVVVHCSAGVGRTGTYIALDILLRQLGAEGAVDIYDLIIKLRTKRTEMVQSMDQYVLLHKLVKEHHVFGDTDCPLDRFEEVYNRLQRPDEETGVCGFESQFDLLSKSYPINRRFGAALLPANKDKNRDIEAISYDHSKVFIRMRPSEHHLVYYNASNVEAYDVNAKMIASQGPTESTVEDFWRVIVDNYVTCIVMVTPLMKGAEEQCHRYWPDEESAEHGEISVKAESTTDHGHFSESKLTVEHDQRSNDVTHVRYLAWEDESKPPPQVGEAMLEIAAFVAKQLQKTSSNPRPRVLIHCSDGAGRTGVLCAVINLLDRMTREDSVDVFRAVKDLRDCRPLMVRTKEQYRLCYDIIQLCLSKREPDLC